MTDRTQETDSDETEGRKLYRDRADTFARAQTHIAKRAVRVVSEAERDDPPGETPADG
jgi:hypothetical protein